MKYFILFFVSMLSCAFSGLTQNVQLHYDFGEDRKMPTTTVEMFKPDKFGNTFFFVDFDYGSKSSGVDGICLGYWEIARVFKTESMPVGIHAEYDGGMGRYAVAGTEYAYRINDAWLGGVDYSWNAEDFSKGFSLKAMYKYIDAKNDASFQLTGVWFWHFLDKKITFMGFVDFWREDSDFDYDGQADAKFTFLSEPQFWYNVTENLSAGGEIEFSNNFGGHDGFMVNPTLALKWNF